MLVPVAIIKRMMTQRQITLWLMGLTTVGALLVTLGLFTTNSPSIEIYGSVYAIGIFSLLFWAYRWGWDLARYVFMVVSVLLAAFVTQEPYVSEKFSVIVFIPPTLALILANPMWVVGSAVALMITLIIRAEGQGVYTEPVNLALYTITIGSFILSRAMTQMAQRTAEANAHRAEVALQRSEAYTRVLAQRTREVQESETKFRTLAETTAAGIFICKAKRVRYVNAATSVITGYTRAELCAMDPMALFRSDFCAYHGKWMQQTLTRFELPILTKQGEERWLDATIGDIEFEGAPALLITAFDITARKQAEADLVAERASLAQRVAERTEALKTANVELAQAARLKDEFLASMSHELRTPLNSILGLAESLREDVYGPLLESQVKSLDQIEESGQHLLSLINDILDLSKIAAGKMQLTIHPVDVQEICESSVQLIRQVARKKHIRVSYVFDSAVKYIQADERRLKQIFINLLGNAVKFTPEGGTIGLEFYGDAARHTVQFVIWDTGIGIAQEDIQRLFQPFVQLDSRLARQFEGSGLGLALVSQLTELHGGGVTVASEANAGSRFTITLPWQQHNGTVERFQLAQTELSPPTAPANQFPRGGSATTVLIAEDNQDNVTTIVDYLYAKGYNIVVAHNGVDVIKQAELVQPDIILMDIQMPEMDGLEAIQRLRAITDFATTPILALTALVMPGDRERCFAAGANAYLSKPVSLKQLVTLIDEHVHAARQPPDSV